MEQLTLLTTSSLEKIFADEPFSAPYSYTKASMLINERFSYQVAYCWQGVLQKNVSVKATGSLADYVLIRQVGLVPSQLPVSTETDGYVLRTTPGLYPDPLFTIAQDFALIPGQWRSLWITIPEDCQVPSGLFEIGICFYNEKREKLGECTFEIERIPAFLPPQKLFHTEWFHCDCLATWYKTPVFSNKHWELIEAYMRCASQYGINMILTPLFTPPLDTAEGAQRPTVQLVGVAWRNGRYHFDYRRLSKWIHLCEQTGIKYLEFSHLFAQWGAKHAPKIMVQENGERKMKFGWETDAASPEYRDFLKQFLTSFVRFLRKNKLTDKCFFHVSDEPHEEQLPAYRYAKQLLEEYTDGLPIIDAISSYHLYKESKMQIPVCASDYITPFLEHQTENLWTYYCSGQGKEVSNRFLSMPSSRNRSIGLALFKYQISGFLHWGFNFWYSELSRYPINPYLVTDASCRYPSGDAFVVYPGEEGPIPSLRLEVFFQALQDVRRMELLETYTSHEAVIELLENGLDFPISFKSYPHSSHWMLLKQEEINQRLKKYTVI